MLFRAPKDPYREQMHTFLELNKMRFESESKRVGSLEKYIKLSCLGICVNCILVMFIGDSSNE